jgi:hypothetical protein
VKLNAQLSPRLPNTLSVAFSGRLRTARPYSRALRLHRLRLPQRIRSRQPHPRRNGSLRSRGS